MLSGPLVLASVAVIAAFEQVDAGDRFKKLFGKSKENSDDAPAVPKTPMQEYAAKFRSCIDESTNVEKDRGVDVRFTKSGSDTVVDMIVKRGTPAAVGRPVVKPESIAVPAGFAACTKVPGYDEAKFRDVLKAFLYTPTTNFKEFNLKASVLDSRPFGKGSFADFLKKIDQFPYPEDGNWADKLVAP